MKHIRNIRKAWFRLGELIVQHAEAVRQHKPRVHLQMEMQSVRESILDYEARQERKLIATRVALREAILVGQANSRPSA